MAARRTGSRPHREGKGPPPAPLSDLSSTLSGEIARCLTRAFEHAEVLESVAAQSIAVTGDTFGNLSAADLRRRAHAIGGLVAHALAAVAELQFVAGRLETLAVIQTARDAELDGAVTR